MAIEWTDDQRTRATTSEDYWLATVRPDPAAHLVPIWAVLLDDVFYMATQTQAQKVKNLKAHTRAALSTNDSRHPIIVEGVTDFLELPATEKVQEAFQTKYNWNLNGETDPYILIVLTPDKLIAW
jgi:hypothetical protein